MNILLTNDDGYLSEGINSLFDVLSTEHRVYIIAPDKEKSACSSAITVRSSIKMQNISENVFSVKGYPSDCVNIGLNGDILPEIGLVIAGINHGPNLGDDIYFSGTVAGARTAYIFGVSGIAISMDCLTSSDYFMDAATFLLNFIRDFDWISNQNHILLNINYPDIGTNKIPGLKYTHLGKREYQDTYKVIHRDSNEMSLQLDGTIESVENDGSDITELRKGYISITPLSLDCTDYAYLKRLKQTEELWLK
jgi:5'-nucleotidase